MLTTRILRHPISLVLLTFFLNVAPSSFLPFSYLYRNFSLSSQSVALLLVTLIFLVALPLATIIFVFNEKPAAFGWRLPSDLREAKKVAAYAILALLPFILFFSTQDIFRGYYSTYGVSISDFLLKAVFLTFFYYLAEEFLFHGFLFFGLWSRVRYHSFWIVSLLFAFLHIGKPPTEIIFSFFASLLFCYLSLKTKSFLPAAIVHYTIALMLNIIATFIWYDSLKTFF